MPEEEKVQMTIGEAQTLLAILQNDYMSKQAAQVLDEAQQWQARMRIVELTNAIQSSILFSPVSPGWWSRAWEEVQRE